MNRFCIEGVTALARQIERCATREQALNQLDQFQRCPASQMLSSGETEVLMRLIFRKLVGKRAA
jgi:hypothetical protein